MLSRLAIARKETFSSMFRFTTSSLKLRQWRRRLSLKRAVKFLWHSLQTNLCVLLIIKARNVPDCFLTNPFFFVLKLKHLGQRLFNHNNLVKVLSKLRTRVNIKGVSPKTGHEITEVFARSLGLEIR